MASTPGMTHNPHALARASDRCRHPRARVPQGMWLLIGILALQWQCVAVTADKCTDADLDRPDATTIYRSPSNATEAVLLRPDCTFERVPISRDQEKLTDASRTLNFTGMGAEQVVSYPSTVNTFVLDRNAVHEANFSTAMDLRFLILRRSQLTNVDKFIMPPSLFTLDLRGNAMHSLNGSKLPDTTYSIIISENKLQNLDNFIFPRSLRQLYLEINRLTTIQKVTFPPALSELYLDANPITDLDYAVLPDSLQTLSCIDCGIKSIVGFRLPSQLLNLNLTETQVDKFELRQSDLDIFRGLVKLDISSRQSEPCSDPEATFQVVREVPICVISDTRFEEKVQLQLRSTPSPTSTSNSPHTSNTKHAALGVTTIVIVVVVSLLVACGLALAFIWYRRRQQHRSKPDSLIDNEATVTATRTGNDTSRMLNSVMSNQEYFRNDIRIDENILLHRLAHEDIHVVREIAKGGYGVVYLARFDGRNVVLKRILEQKSRDTVIIQSFMDEIRLCARLEHPKIVKFVGIVWTTLADLGVVIEYMDRGDLCTLLHKERQIGGGSSWYDASNYLPAKRSLAVDVAEALVYLHSFDNAIIHRDLKARNVLVNEQGTAKLSDFGISREQTLDETMTGEVGTAAWIAPEVLQGERYRESADIYSFGIFMAELDKCSHPYDDTIKSATSGVGPSNIRLAVLVSAGLARPKMSADCPSSVQELVAHCLSQDATQRPTAVELLSALRKL